MPGDYRVLPAEHADVDAGDADGGIQQLLPVRFSGALPWPAASLKKEKAFGEAVSVWLCRNRVYAGSLAEEYEANTSAPREVRTSAQEEIN